MNEINQTNLESQRALTPEEIEVLRKHREAQETQAKAGEFLDDRENKSIRQAGVEFNADKGPSSAHTETVDQIIAPNESLPKPQVHNEAGIPLRTEYHSEKEATSDLEKLINGKGKLSGNVLQEKMASAWEQFNKEKEQP